MSKLLTDPGITVAAPPVTHKPLATPEAVRQPPPKSGLLPWLLRTAPTALVVAGLAGLGFWGHQTGWKLPSFSEMNGTASADDGAWCEEHSVPESVCVECNPRLLPPPKDYGFCKTHGVHNCPLDHPDVAQLAKTPRISPAEVERARQGLATKKRAENNPKCPLYRRRVQFESESAMAKAGVDMVPVEERRVVEAISANGEIGYDPTRVARLATPVPGRVWRVDKQVGDNVTEGDTLALIDAVEVGKAKAEFLQALALVDVRGKTVERQRPLVGGAVSPIQFQEAEAGLREAQIRLVSAQQALVNLGLPVKPEDLRGLSPDDANRHMQFLGLPETVARNLDAKTTTANLFPIKAPLTGVVVTRDAAVGEFVGTSTPLFVIVDVSRMWLTLHVRSEDAKHLTLDRLVRFKPDAGGPEATGKVDWISTAVDKEKTRTLQVRSVLENPDRRLRAGTFGTGDIILRDEPNALTVPNEAVHWDGSCNVVFVQDKDFFKPGPHKVFHTRTIRPGVKDGKNTEIIVGLLPNEVVAGKGSGVLRAELLKNLLGAC